MQGHIHRRVLINEAGRKKILWYAIVDLPRGDDGRRRQKWHGGFPTRREADVARLEILRALEAGSYVEKSRLLFGQWVEIHWYRLARPQLKASTFHSYQRNLELHLLPRLGALRFEEITSSRLAGLFASLITEGRQRGAARGPGLSPTTIRYLFGITHRILSDAVIAGLLASNPATGIRLPRIASSGGRELFCWSASELREFLDFTHGHELASAWRLAAFTGMRRGEVLGLRVSDVDLARRRLSVSRALSVSASQVIESTPKNGRSRMIDLDRATTDHLAQLIADRPRSERVIVRADGSSPPPDSVSRRFRLAVIDSGLPRIRLHDLRHTHATLSLGAGVPIRVISERLGHSSPEFTLRRYAHVLPGMGAEAAETFAALLENENPEGQREI